MAKLKKPATADKPEKAEVVKTDVIKEGNVPVEQAEEVIEKHTLLFGFKNGKEVEKEIECPLNKLGSFLNTISEAMKNPSIRGSMSVDNMLFDVTEVAYIITK